MPGQSFSVSLAELERNDQDLSWEISVEWLRQALAGTEASAGGSPGKLSAQLSKRGRQVLVRGRIEASVVMPCSRTLDPVDIQIDAPLYLLLSPKDEQLAERPKARRGAPQAAPARGTSVAAAGRGDKRDTSAKQVGSQRKRRGPKLDQGAPEALPDEVAADDTYEGEQVVLDAFIREQILLELPMFLLRSDLRSESATANGAASSESVQAESSTSGLGSPEPLDQMIHRKQMIRREESPQVDPRLLPLALLAEQMRKKAKE